MNSVNFLIDEKRVVEIKAAKKLNPSDLKGLFAIREEFKELNLIGGCQVEKPMQFEGVVVLLIDQSVSLPCSNIWCKNHI